MYSIADYITPGMASMMLMEDICKRCIINNHPDEDTLIVFDICRSKKCPLKKLEKAIGFKFDGMGYSYAKGMYKIDPENKGRGE
ncbi:hypothetical protein LCGC14_0403930 [marine sediment metagenome]|uniref:Uncharacterized protein n=1 Tax=marine sediment metagenome TaxID=412755 RepID=A0A0F9T1H3_9ZZZZ